MFFLKSQNMITLIRCNSTFPHSPTFTVLGRDFQAIFSKIYEVHIQLSFRFKHNKMT